MKGRALREKRLGVNPRSRSPNNEASALRWFETIATIAGCILLLAALIWRQSYVADRNELRRLYISGSGGDLESVERLSESRSSEAVRLLEKLAQDGRAFSDARMAAIAALTTNLLLIPTLWDLSSRLISRLPSAMLRPKCLNIGAAASSAYQQHFMRFILFGRASRQSKLGPMP